MWEIREDSLCVSVNAWYKNKLMMTEVVALVGKVMIIIIIITLSGFIVKQRA